MKKSISVLVILSMLLMSLNCFAKSADEIIADQEPERQQAYIQMQNILGKQDYNKTSSEDFYGDDILYKYYHFVSGDIISLYKNNGTFKSIISDEYGWILTKKGNDVWQTTFGANEERNGLKQISHGTKAKYTDKNGVEITLDFTIENITKLFSKRLSSENFDDIKLVYNYDYGSTYFLYAAVDGQEYVIPYCVRTDFTGLENGKLYTAKDCLAILDKNMSEVSDAYNNPVDKEDEKQVGGVGGVKNDEPEQTEEPQPEESQPEESQPEPQPQDIETSEDFEIVPTDTEVSEQTPLATDTDEKPDNTVLYIVIASVLAIALITAVLLALKKKK